MGKFPFSRGSDCIICRTGTESHVPIVDDVMSLVRKRLNLLVYSSVARCTAFLDLRKPHQYGPPGFEGCRGPFGRFPTRVSKAWLAAQATRIDRKTQRPLQMPLSPRGLQVSARNSTRSGLASQPNTTPGNTFPIHRQWRKVFACRRSWWRVCSLER